VDAPAVKREAEENLVKGALKMSLAPAERPGPHHDLRPEDRRHLIVEFRIADGESLAISVPAGETHVLKHFRARMPYGLVLPDVP